MFVNSTLDLSGNSFFPWLHKMVYLRFRSVGSQTWIGFKDLNDDDNFVWLNGQPLPDDDGNWRGGKHNFN